MSSILNYLTAILLIYTVIITIAYFRKTRNVTLAGPELQEALDVDSIHVWLDKVDESRELERQRELDKHRIGWKAGDEEKAPIESSSWGRAEAIERSKLAGVTGKRRSDWSDQGLEGLGTKGDLLGLSAGRHAIPKRPNESFGGFGELGTGNDKVGKLVVVESLDAQGADLPPERPRATFSPVVGPFDTTLVSQASKNRFFMLQHLCRRWSGPMVIAIMEDDFESLPELCDNMRIVAVAANTESVSAVSDEVEEERREGRNEANRRGEGDGAMDLAEFYPINRLRNAGVDMVETSHFFMVDIDMWPDVNAYAGLHEQYLAEPERFDDERNAIVLAAFSRKRFCADDKECSELAADVPDNFDSLMHCLDSSVCERFDSASNSAGHGTTFQYYWQATKKAKDDRILQRVKCIQSHRFEPYMVVKKSSSTPRFDERFVGYGKNKIQWINHLRYLGFKFYVMPTNFVIHAPHPKSRAKSVWEKQGKKSKKSSGKAMDLVFSKFMKELQATLGRKRVVTKLCSKPKNSSKKETTVTGVKKFAKVGDKKSRRQNRI